MPHSLEAPGTDQSPDWASIYRARAEEVQAERPIFTGDVFFDVEVEGEADSKAVIIVQHPCVIRQGVELMPRLLVAEVIAAQKLLPSLWPLHNFRQMPLAELVPAASPPDFAAFFNRQHMVRRENLNLAGRRACMSQKGVNLLLQRWVHHNSRVVALSSDFQTATSSQFDEADIIEDWCTDRGADGVDIASASVEIDTWLTGAGDASAPRARLEDLQQRSAVRREVRAYLDQIRAG